MKINAYHITLIILLCILGGMSLIVLHKLSLVESKILTAPSETNPPPASHPQVDRITVIDRTQPTNYCGNLIPLLVVPEYFHMKAVKVSGYLEKETDGNYRIFLSKEYADHYMYGYSVAIRFGPHQIYNEDEPLEKLEQQYVTIEGVYYADDIDTFLDYYGVIEPTRIY